jgi:hypothetical protein
MDSPINTVNTPMIIGFLTCPYIPSTINFFGGLQGASVPFPFLINVDIVMIMKQNPTAIIIKPIKKVHSCLITMFFSINKGTRINTMMGRINEKSCFVTVFILKELRAE